MKQVLILLVLVAVAVWVGSWFWAGDEVAAAAARPWPDGLGSLASVPKRYPPHHENEAARRLMTLAAAVPTNDAVAAYVRQEIARGELAVAEPPALADVSAIRELLLREPVLWERDIARQHGGLLTKVATYQSLSRTLLASALGRARKDDPAAWQDLHAAWNLTKSLDGHPHYILRVVAMSMARAINGVAWKLPLPVPAWFAEVRERDLVRPMFEMLQYEKWANWKNRKFPVKPFAEAIDRDRTLAGDLARTTECELQHLPATSGVDMSWRRAFRYRAEREATANALRIRAGQAIETRSQCSDGAWSFDGKTLHFAKPIALPEKRDTSMPLTLRAGAL